MLSPDLFQISSEVANALHAGKPIVALESTVISHGLPRPTNLETAYRLESIVREVGAVPATIGIIAGRLIVGLNKDQVQLLAEADDIKKISTRDIPIAVAQNWHGATTVASTSWIAHRAGIRVFATGGLAVSIAVRCRISPQTYLNSHELRSSSSVQARRSFLICLQRVSGWRRTL